jgi:uncharacterized protein YndB with AHSA1/START domain
MSNNKTEVIKNFKEKSIIVSREFDAPIEKVWQAYTDCKLLDQWWGPSPWRAETKRMNFKAGGYWLYAMVGPEGEKHWARMNYLTIDHLKGFDIEDVFCDEEGNVNSDLPVSRGRMSFHKTANGTKVEFAMTYATETDVQKIVEMGFEQGITVCLDQLEQLLKKQFVTS